MKSLEVLAKEHRTDKFDHGYCPHYDEHFFALRHWNKVDLLEVGVYKGASLEMWNGYFSSPAATITGIDIDPMCATLVFESARVNVLIGDVKTVNLPAREWDIIIDDGSHFPADVTATFARLWPRVKPGGWYVIEDYEVHWLPAFSSDSSAIAMADECLHAVLRGSDGPIESLHMKRLPHEAPFVSEMHAYEQLLFLRKPL